MSQLGMLAGYNPAHVNHRKNIVSQSNPIAYTVGEPAGIGADIFIQLAQQQSMADIVVIGDKHLLQARADALQIALPTNLSIEQIDFASATPGHANQANVPAVLEMLNVAIDGCLSGRFSAMVTGPLHKGIINDAGVAFSGHTEYLAERTLAPLPVMLLASHTMRVALVTTHLPLKDVSAAITQLKVIDVCRIVANDLTHKFGISAPRILVCGLNPHAGEGGHLGREEIDTISPALEVLRKQGINVVGPLPADTLFTQKFMRDADVAIAMYHDQGLPVIKSHAFGQAANITLGLPIIRTSVDHGTAFDLAGTGLADTGSLDTAIRVAREMVMAQTQEHSQ